MKPEELFGLYTVAQKYIDMPSGQLAGVELLTRVRSGSGTNTVETFIHSLTVDGLWAITERQMQEARAIYDQWGVVCSVNIDNRMIESDARANRLVQALEAIPGPMTLEFTETFPMPEPGRVNQLFRRLREAGATISLDDFGSGFNGMSLFTDYDFDVVKIDRSLVQDIADRPQKSSVLKLVGEMIKVLNKQHIVEGIETEEQAQCLLSLGFSRFQGYLYHRPEDISEMRF